MVFKLKGNDVIKEQDIEVTESLIGIYGYNNSGKTTILKELDKVIDEENIKCIVNDGRYIRSLFIPTNRVIVRQAHTSSTQIKDIEEFLAYKKDSYNEFDLHLKVIRENMLGNSAVKQVIKNAILYMFGEDYEFDFDRRQSDGVENIINIYCSIIWLFTWDKDIEDIKYDKLKQLLCDTSAVVMIDEEDGVVKKIVYGPDFIELHSINPMYPVRRFENEDVTRIRVFGLVREIKRKF